MSNCYTDKINENRRQIIDLLSLAIKNSIESLVSRAAPKEVSPSQPICGDKTCRFIRLGALTDLLYSLELEKYGRTGDHYCAKSVREVLALVKQIAIPTWDKNHKCFQLKNLRSEFIFEHIFPTAHYWGGPTWGGGDLCGINLRTMGLTLSEFTQV